MIVHQILREMNQKNLTKSFLADQMKTSRAAINRLLDPNNKSVTLTTLENVAEVLDLELEIYLK